MTEHIRLAYSESSDHHDYAVGEGVVPLPIHWQGFVLPKSHRNPVHQSLMTLNSREGDGRGRIIDLGRRDSRLFRTTENLFIKPAECIDFAIELLYTRIRGGPFRVSFPACLRGSASSLRRAASLR